MKQYLAMMVSVAALGVSAQGTVSRDEFLRQQAVAEMQRVSAQVDVLASNQEDLSSRISKAERMRNEIDALKAEINSLRATIGSLRSEMQSQRGKIVDDISKKVAALQPPPAPRPAPTPKASYSGPCVEYTIQSGDSLFLIAKAFNTSVPKIKEINGMKGDSIRVGQKIKVPKEY